MNDETQRAILDLDLAIAESGDAIWVGSEPTFTDRRLETPEWLCEALGDDKEARARDMLGLLRRARPGSLVLRCLGRQYQGEKRPRWSYGLYQRRDGGPVWTGPPDPLAGGGGCSAEAFRAFAEHLTGRLAQRKWGVAEIPARPAGEVRLALRLDDQPPPTDPKREPELVRDPVQEHPIPSTGAVDLLARRGTYLLILTHQPLAEASLDQPGVAVPRLELPAFDSVEVFLAFLQALGAAAADANLSGLVLAGFPPPVDTSIAWTTLTPDPAVLEVNLAPAPDLATFLTWNRELFGAADQVGLSPFRLHYNGTLADSGGGGQVTLGGPEPQTSPFLTHPRLLPRLLRYLIAHPSLSYWFAPAYLGSASQAPRVDEGVRDNFTELALALEQLERIDNPTPQLLWANLSPFLCDPSGNPHRSELNIEKLWNPYLPVRGQLGLVEFRAFRMAVGPEQAAALAALLRALAAMLIRQDPAPELIDWGDELHQRFALPHYLITDLEEVLADLANAGLGLPEVLAAQLLDGQSRDIGAVDIDGCRIELASALEFWPLLGDVASQESGGSRLVDSSTGRLQILVRPLEDPSYDLDQWTLTINGYRLRMRPDTDRQGPLRLLGVRFRRFVPERGLHPGIGAQDPVEIIVSNPTIPRALMLRVHEWRPDMLPYTGLPADRMEAGCRRRERFVYQFTTPASECRDAPASAYSPYTFDLRRLPAL
jgi:uncharacterized protein (DUF2126 family)